MPTVEVVEYTDPWCSWAWGTEPKVRKLRWRWGDRLAWRTVMGDLVQKRAQDEVSDPDAVGRVAAHWRKVHSRTGMPWPVELRWAPSSSAVAGCAVKAAGRQDGAAASRLLRSLRESCFVFSAPADRPDRVVALAAGIPGLDAGQLSKDIDSDEVAESFLADREETRRPNDYVLRLKETHEGKGNAKPDGDGWRYVFPTLLFRGPGGEFTVPGWQPWAAYEAAMESAVPGSTSGGRADPTPEEALAEWATITEQELLFLCGKGSRPPTEAVAYDWGAGQAWLRRDVARPVLT